MGYCTCTGSTWEHPDRIADPLSYIRLTAIYFVCLLRGKKYTWTDVNLNKSQNNKKLSSEDAVVKTGVLLLL